MSKKKHNEYPFAIAEGSIKDGGSDFYFCVQKSESETYVEGYARTQQYAWRLAVLALNACSEEIAIESASKN